MNLYTSDLHFGHTNVIGFDHRPFTDRDEMDRVMIELWNGRVQPDDTVYILGDICYHSQYGAEWYLRQLKGHKILILGNHDVPILSNPKALHYLEGVERMMHVQDGDKQISLCHFPIAEWNGYFRETWHIYGHIHNRKNETYEFMKNKEHALNAGCMINNYAPASFNELVRNNAIFKAKDGEIYDFDGKKCIAIGGAYSVDKWYRLQMGYPWFDDEQPSDEIKKYVESQLEKNDWKIDVVLSHTLPFEYMPIDLFISGIDQSTVDNSTEHWLSDIEIKLNYKWWYAGHYHTSRITDKVQIMFEDIEEFGIHGGLRQSDDTAII